MFHRITLKKERPLTKRFFLKHKAEKKYFKPVNVIVWNTDDYYLTWKPLNNAFILFINALGGVVLGMQSLILKKNN